MAYNPFTDRKVTQVPLNEAITLLDDNGQSTFYVVRGTERALIIDTANGYADVLAYARQMTDLPLDVVNTHGHIDHILGNVYAEAAWLHPADWALHDEMFRFPQVKAELEKYGKEPCPLRPLAIGQGFDLGGGLTLEVIPLPGHTAGSVGLLDRKHRILFTGDGLNCHCWMQLKESLPIEALITTLEAVEARWRKDYDYILTGHAKGLEDASATERLLACARSLAAGDTAFDTPYEWFDGVCKFHRFPAPSGKGEGIVYGESIPKA